MLLLHETAYIKQDIGKGAETLHSTLTGLCLRTDGKRGNTSFFKEPPKARRGLSISPSQEHRFGALQHTAQYILKLLELHISTRCLKNINLDKLTLPVKDRIICWYQTLMVWIPLVPATLWITPFDCSSEMAPENLHREEITPRLCDLNTEKPHRKAPRSHGYCCFISGHLLGTGCTCSSCQRAHRGINK